MTDYQTHNELRRLRRGHLVTLAIAFGTAFAFIWGNDIAIMVAMATQIVIWGTWSLLIRSDIRLLKKRLTYAPPPRNVIPLRDTRGN